MDNLVWNNHQRYSDIERDSKLAEILQRKDWIIEGVHYKWVLDSFRDADLIIVMIPNRLIRDFWLIRRFIRTRIGLEIWNYKQSVRNLIEMIKWNKKYDREHIHHILALTDSYSNKRMVVRNQDEILSHVAKWLRKR
ncbi:hypothetical protein [Paenibacillus guangzhouensis]|uniref:hypothetical protein n=1 Tax=Paenibacillus guangzhouensis TaxID=1473112 RepID=UPI001D0FD624|nr:hypothetical protein [Paenibacillus guangzhouensis]